ncbi:DUF59 domain-containing protein [Candidatus Saccharibacteria bacterium]|nr:DUF59 domain-containing protein [Candidatus Saccharibacteria bacterium]
MKKAIISSLKKVIDPELKLNVVDLGLIYKIQESGGKVSVEMTATTPFCPYLSELLSGVKRAVLATDGVKEAKVEVVWDPPWSLERLSEEAKAQLGIL